MEGTDPYAEYARLSDNISTALTEAWNNIQASRELIVYATTLMGNPSLKARWLMVERQAKKVSFAYMMLAELWDRTPEGKHIREEASK